MVGYLSRGRGISNTVNTNWIHSMHRCAEVHNGMVSLAGLQHKTSEQHIELGKSRIKRDVTDLEKLYSWFLQHDPFDVNEHSLRCTSTGLTAPDDDCINCDRAEEIGKGIQLTLDGVSVAEATVKGIH